MREKMLALILFMFVCLFFFLRGGGGGIIFADRRKNRKIAKIRTRKNFMPRYFKM